MPANRSRQGEAGEAEEGSLRTWVVVLKAASLTFGKSMSPLLLKSMILELVLVLESLEVAAVSIICVATANSVRSTDKWGKNRL